MYCFNISVECQFLELAVVEDLSKLGLITVLKSPPIMTVESDKLDSESKNVWKKAGSSVLGPYILAIV